jgi:hypothetical protein
MREGLRIRGSFRIAALPLSHRERVPEGRERVRFQVGNDTAPWRISTPRI